MLVRGVTKGSFLIYIDEYQTWKIKVHYKNNVLTDYSLFNISYPKQRELIDFKNSSFYLGKFSDHKHVGEDINISDYDNYLSTLEVLKNSKDSFLKQKKSNLGFEVCES